MSRLTSEEETQKKAIYERMTPRQQKYILRVGYKNWDPFAPPKDPIDIRMGELKRTAMDLMRDFLKSRTGPDPHEVFRQGAWEMCLGLIREEERFQGMFEFSLWYAALLRKEERS
jgi:hypothetical protein